MLDLVDRLLFRMFNDGASVLGNGGGSVGGRAGGGGGGCSGGGGRVAEDANCDFWCLTVAIGGYGGGGGGGGDTSVLPMLTVFWLKIIV